MKLGYFPGCSLSGTGKEYDLSLRATLAALGVGFEDLADWSCCGATSAHVTNHLLAAALPLHNIALAHAQGMDEVLAPCAACYSRLASSQHAVARDEKLRRRVEEVLESPLPARMPVLSIIEILQRVGTEGIASRVKLPLDGIKVACYYGCLLVRPPEIVHFDDPEHPTSMEALVASTGATPVEWNFKTECCGAAHAIAHTEIVVDLSRKILDDARAHGADVVVVACPMCHSNLDTRQNAMRRLGAMANMPVLYLTELIGLALGIDEKALGLGMHLAKATGVPSLAKKEATA